jgi:acetylornithine deacetylase/succinyl-diaminopimelate desuccinylase-like protein
MPNGQPSREPDWAIAEQETIAHLQAMIRLDTSNPPGNEITVARYLDGVLEAAGIETHLLEPAPGRAALVARLKGNGAKQPVMLLAHMDTVGVDRAGWSVDPFGGVISDGYLYGRGAIDDKGMLAANLETMLLLKRTVVDAGAELSRDVIFVASADEETGGEWGIGWLISHHPELLRAEFAVNEGGRTRIVGGKALYLAVQNSEKVPHAVEVVARGAGGHAAVPHDDNAIFRLARALAKIGAHREPLDVKPTTREFFLELSEVWPDRSQGQAMADVASPAPESQERGARILAGIPVLDAVLRNGISATIISGGNRTNVIPVEAKATLNIRTMPGASLDDVLERLTHAVNDRGIELRVVARGEDAPVSDFASPMFTAIAESTRALDPGMAVVPYLSTGATDSAHLRRIGIQAYGILPFPMDQNDEERMHGNDERIPLASLAFGTRVIFGAIRRVAR